jgi:integrase
MACIRKRRGKWIADYRDGAGCRHVPSFDTRREAEDFLARRVPESRQVMKPAVDSNITMAVYSERWLGLVQGHLKTRTLASYQHTLRLHILPELGSLKVRNVSRSHVRTMLSEKLRTGKIKRITEGTSVKDLRVPLARASVRIIHATLRALLNAAVDEGIIAINPAERLGRHLRLVAPATARQEEIKAMTRRQLANLLGASAAAAKEYERRHYELFLLLARTGMRLGEALALQWEDVDFPNREIRVARAFSAGRIETPKSGHGRTVDVSNQLAANLMRLKVIRKEGYSSGGGASCRPGYSVRRKAPHWTKAGCGRSLPRR